MRRYVHSWKTGDTDILLTARRRLKIGRGDSWDFDQESSNAKAKEQVRQVWE